MSTQMALDLFAIAPPPPKPTSIESFLRWAHGTHECGAEIDAIAERLFAEMPWPFDRGKALVMACGHGRFDQQIIDALGLFDETLDYHVCWDRAWAATHGIPKSLISRVHRCDYRCGRGRHKFYDADGRLIYESNGDRRD